MKLSLEYPVAIESLDHPVMNENLEHPATTETQSRTSNHK
jgi:hypothetical protein